MKDVIFAFLIAIPLGAAINSMKFPPLFGGEPPSQSAPAETPTPGQPSSTSSSSSTSSNNISPVTDANFEQEVLKSKTPVLVDFWAPWCAPCVRMGPVIEQLAAENAGKLKVLKLNVDDNPMAGSEFAGNGIPAFYIFKNGKIADRIIGAAPKQFLAQSIAKVCGTPASAATSDIFAAAPLPGIDGSANQTVEPVVLATSENSEVPLLDEAGFDRDVIKSATPALVFFCDSSEQCNRAWTTILSVAGRVSDRYRVVRVNVAAHPILASEYFVSSVPTLVIFKDGKRTKQMSGVVPEQDLLSFLEVPNTASAETPKTTF